MLRLRWFSLAASILWCSTALADVTECDRLATHPDDPDRVAPGLESNEVDLPAAERACRAAVAADPRHARSQYHLGRTLYYQGKFEESLPPLRAATDGGYRQAIFVLGYILADGKVTRDNCKAGELWLRSAGLEHPWSGFHLVEKALAGRFAQCSFKLSDADLKRYLTLAEDHITITASAGRLEALRKKYDARPTTPASGD